MASDEGALLPGRLGQGRERHRHPLGSGDAPELPVAVLRHVGVRSERDRRQLPRIFSNPKPIQTDYFAEGQQLVDFKIGFLNEIPVIWTVFAVVIIVGAIYYYAVQKKKPYEAIHPPRRRTSRASRRRA